jgi:hypothetical protein
MGLPGALPNIMGRSLTIPLCAFSQAQLLVETKYPYQAQPLSLAIWPIPIGITKVEHGGIID